MTCGDLVVSSAQTKTASSSMIGRAIVGGVVAGGVGAIIGGVTAKQKTTATPGVHTYTIWITLNDMSNPQMILRFFNKEKEARQIGAILSLIINKNNIKNLE